MTIVSQFQQSPAAPGANTPAPAYAAKVPESITTTDVVETSRLGRLEFFDGMPSDETVRKVYDQLDFSRAAETFLTGCPAASVTCCSPRLTLWCGSTKSPLRRVRERVGRITSHSPISFDANRAVPPFSLAEQRRIREFPQFSTMGWASPWP